MKRVELRGKLCDGDTLSTRMRVSPGRAPCANGAVLMMLEVTTGRWKKRVTAECHGVTGIWEISYGTPERAVEGSCFPGRTRLLRDFAVESASPDRKIELRVEMASRRAACPGFISGSRVQQKARVGGAPESVQNSECSRIAPMETGPRSRL